MAPTFTQLRESAHMDKHQAAGHIGVSYGCVVHWENGTRPVPRYAMLAMQRAAEAEANERRKA